MNAEQTRHRTHHEAGPVTTGPRAKQGDRRTFTFWILVVSTVVAALVGIVLLAARTEYTSKPPAPVTAGAPANQTPPDVPKPAQ
jgi:hypothetical protein